MGQDGSVVEPIATFGGLLRHLRQRARLTQEELGVAVGYSRAHVARLENGQRVPDPELVRARFPDALGLQTEPQLSSRLLELAAAMRNDASPGDAKTLQPIESQVPNNLPVQVTSFIEHAGELTELTRLLPTTHLLTLTGSGGVGKTRLALQLAQRADVIEAYPDGVWLVELAPVSDPTFVLRAIAGVLSVHEETGRPLLTSLVESLRTYERQLLLILDNCEHVIGACAQFADAVLRSGVNARILATSREGLGVHGEQSWRVTSLQTPAAGDALPLGELAQVEAVRLFVERARLVQPGFALAAANAPAVRQIVTQLDGIPLAIELAAARMGALTAQKISERLDDRLRLLTGGSRTALPRQQTLRATLDWSYDLLSEPERILLQRLAVFTGGWTLEACEVICAGTGLKSAGAESADIDILELLTRLVDKSLVVMVATEGGLDERNHLLETVRQYARERLVDTAEEVQMRDRHLDYFVRLGQTVGPQLLGDGHNDPATVMKRVAPDLDNVRSALVWALETGRTDEGMQLVDGFMNVLYVQAGQTELVEWHCRVLTQWSHQKPTLAYGQAFCHLSWLYIQQAEWDKASAAAENMLSIGIALDDVHLQGDAYVSLTWTEILRGGLPLARSYAEKGRDIVMASPVFDEKRRIRYTLPLYSGLAFYEGDYAQALALTRQEYKLLAEEKSTMVTSNRARIIAYCLLYLNEAAQAGPWLRESLIDNAALGDKQAVAACLAAFAALALLREELCKAARLFGASEALCEVIRTPLQSWDAVQVCRNIAALRERLDKVTLNAAWAEGRALSMQQAMDEALAFAG